MVDQVMAQDFDDHRRCDLILSLCVAEQLPAAVPLARPVDFRSRFGTGSLHFRRRFQVMAQRLFKFRVALFADGLGGTGGCAGVRLRKEKGIAMVAGGLMPAFVPIFFTKSILMLGLFPAEDPIPARCDIELSDSC